VLAPLHRKLHIAHHHDRADTVEFDYRAFIRGLPSPCRRAIVAAEWALVPAVELLMHARTALAPLAPGCRMPLRRRANAALGSVVVAACWLALYASGGLIACMLYFAATTLFLHTLSAHDAFQHTYEVLLPAADGSYVSGPGARTAAYEEENTFSNVLSDAHPWLNVLSLNFGYHNAHHAKPMTPWYKLPALHARIYGDAAAAAAKNASVLRPSVHTCPQLLPFRTLAATWLSNRLRRVLEEDYGVVAKGTAEDRAARFVGSLGVSFLTV
jgi:fatty acid desaturase